MENVEDFILNLPSDERVIVSTLRTLIPEQILGFAKNFRMEFLTTLAIEEFALSGPPQLLKDLRWPKFLSDFVTVIYFPMSAISFLIKVGNKYTLFGFLH
jgi:hypothetical protein